VIAGNTRQRTEWEIEKLFPRYDKYHNFKDNLRQINGRTVQFSMKCSSQR